MKQASVIFNRAFVKGAVDERLKGSFVEHLGRCMYGGVYEPGHERADADGFREDVKELVRELGVTAIRYPGGNFVSGYDWKDGVGPKEQRPHRRDLAWHVLETNEVGTNEFARFAKECGVELFMAVNLGTGTPKEAGELVDYCNGNGDTYWSALRKEHGEEEPHGIRVWCLGNEMDGEWQIQMHTAQEYARLAKETAKIVKWTDPSAEIIACGSCTNEDGHLSFGEWDRTVLEEGYEYIDYISLHRYFNYHMDKQLFYPPRESLGDVPFFFRDLRNYLDTIISCCDFVKGKKKSDHTVQISFDEWGVVTDSGAVPGMQEQDYGFAVFHELDAVIYGGILCTFLNYADRVKIACQSLLVNEGGMITTDPQGKAIRQATFYPFQDFAKYAKGVSLQPVTDYPCKQTDHHGEQETIVSAAVYEQETGELTIFAVNCDLEEDCTLTVNLQGFEKIEAVQRRELYTPDYQSFNSFENEFAVVPAELEPVPAQNGVVNVVLKKHSWNVLRYRCLKQSADK